MTTRKQLVRAVCIGWNSVDPAKWGGFNGRLSDCEQDARLWAMIWGSLNINTVELQTENATIAACRQVLRWGLDGMQAGDMLIVCVSGHGGQQFDAHGEGADRLGEYLCAYDGPITDNTVNEWLTLVPPGVRILWICDTCHSGTMFRGPTGENAKPVQFRAAAIPREFKGELILLAGCGENRYSLSTGNGGQWTNALTATGPQGQSPISWYIAAKEIMPREQAPVWAEYGEVTREFRSGPLLEHGLVTLPRPTPSQLAARSRPAARQAIVDIQDERRRQDLQWGEQNHDPFTYLAILTEEIGELAQCALHARFGGDKAAFMRAEAVQVAAVAQAIVECLDRGKWEWPKP